MNAEIARAKHVQTHLKFDLLHCPYESRHGERCKKVPSGREAVIKCEILQSAMIQGQGKRNHKEREHSQGVGRKKNCIEECR